MKQYRYKITAQNTQTYNNTQWVVGEWKETNGKGELCSSGWLHCYCDPLLAVLHNPIHANVTNPKLWIVEVEGECKRDDQMKEGWTRMRLIEEIDLPTITVEQRVAYGILCALEICRDDKFVRWAEGWLSGEDRSCGAAKAAEAAWAAAKAAKAAWAAEAAWAAVEAANAAWAAVETKTTANPLNLLLIATKVLTY